MTRRLAIVITGVVVATLLLAGVTTLAVGAARARQVTRSQLRAQVTDLAAGVSTAIENTDGSPAAVRRRLAWLRAFQHALDLEGLAVVIERGDGTLAGADLPTGFDESWLDRAALQRGEVVDGNDADLVWAAAPTLVTADDGVTRLLLVVVTDRANSGLRSAAGTLVLAALVTLALGIGAAVILGRRLTRPVRDVSALAATIAGGDLSARLPEPPVDRDDELSDLARSVNVMASELERVHGQEQQFLLSVSHDLRTPLTSIRGYADAITDGAGDPQHAASVIRSEAARLDRLVADLLDLATLRARAFSLQMRPVELTTLAASVANGFLPDAAACCVAITVDSPTDDGEPASMLVEADPDRLGQIIANLIENALRYATSAVQLRIVADGGWARLIVGDDGDGIAASDVTHVFDRLYSGSGQPRRREAASGLGLAIVKELVLAMGGSVMAGNNAGGGARFEVLLPRSEH